MAAGPLFQHEASDIHKALVADDDAIMQGILRSLLQDAGYTVILAANGREALASAAISQVSIAFIDLAMPEGNGLQICSALRKMPKWSDVPIIILTHFSLNQALDASLEAGANGFLCKPLIPSEFLWCLEAHTRRRSSSIMKGSASQLAAADQLNFPAEQRSPFQFPWMLQTSQASLDRQLNALKNLTASENTHNAQATFFINELYPNLVHGDCSGESANSIVLDGEAVAAQIIPHQASLQNGHMHLAPEMETFYRVAALFAPGGLARLLGLLVVSVEEILTRLRNGEGAARSHDLLDCLHKLAGTAGTLGCGSLSAAARELEYNLSTSVEHCFIKISSETLRVINTYIDLQSNSMSAVLLSCNTRVLVVDDTLMNRDIASAFLGAAGHVVTCVEGGGDAVVAVATADFDVVLMDVRMPDVDGLEATRRIRKLDGTRSRVPIVALTAQAFPEQIAECLRAGMDGHLAKPFNSETLLAAVARATDVNQHHKIKVNS